MRAATLTPEAKSLLGKTVRELRERLLGDLRAAAESDYRLALPLAKAGLDESARARRSRLEGLIDERARATKPKNAKELESTRQRLWREAEKEAASTLLLRVVLLRQLEAQGLSRPKVATGAWESQGYRELADFAPALLGDPTRGMSLLLRLLWDELALELPGLFGDVGTTRLFPVPPETLREVLERLGDPRLEGGWTDDTTLGWVYQFWNDPDREALDKKIKDGGKIEPHEIASKTQMFTERYMVEWLLQNSLGPMWLAMCRKRGWMADAEAVLPVLDARRADWRARREAGQVKLDELMPIESELEDRWKYYVPQPLPADAVTSAPESVRAIRILDPACGSGHFLVIAFDLLAELYREEAHQLGITISDVEIAASILENNLHGIDIDPRAIQIAAAALYLKARTFAPGGRPKQLNLVAPALKLGNLTPDDEALVRLRAELQQVGIPGQLTNTLVSALAGVDHLGSLLKVDAAVDEAIARTEQVLRGRRPQGDLFRGFPAQQQALSVVEARSTVIDKLEEFLGHHSSSEDLGLRLDSEQLAAGLRFVRMCREGLYDLVVGNPPYQGTSKMANAGYLATHYPRGKDNLYAAFLERGLDLVRSGGTSALLTMRGWMFLGQFTELRSYLLHSCDIRCLGDVDRGAFEDVPDEVLATAMAVIRRDVPLAAESRQLAIAMQPTPLSDRSRDHLRTQRKRAAILAQVGRYEFTPHGFVAIDNEPMVYWWSHDLLRRYGETPKLAEMAPVAVGLQTSDNTRFVRAWWEVLPSRVLVSRSNISVHQIEAWVPYIKGGGGRVWIEPLSHVVYWRDAGLQIKTFEVGGKIASRPQNERLYFQQGVAFSAIGSQFTARMHRYTSIFDSMGSSVFPAEREEVCCLMNSRTGRFILESLNPTVHFQVGDVNRLPGFSISSAADIFSRLERAFQEHTKGCEEFVEFVRPGPSAWNGMQEWAQRAVDRAEGEPLPDCAPAAVPPVFESFISFALGVALGRFGANGEGILSEPPSAALPAGMLFVTPEGPDSIDHPACRMLRDRWEEHGDAVGSGDDLRTYVRKSFFAYHKKVYENRPIYFPLSSAKKSFVAWVSIHRWDDRTLKTLLADHLLIHRQRLEGELSDLRRTRDQAGKRNRKQEDRHAELQKLLEELGAFIEAVTAIDTHGAPPTDGACPRREVDAPFAMDLDDGIMINSAALWPLLEPQWKDQASPKKWWKELCLAQGKKDYDWAHLAAHYFPKRVDAKCQKDPSLAVTHGCFWRYHPAKAFAWELRLKDEIGPDFQVDEADSDACRRRFLADHAAEARELEKDEEARRDRKRRKSTEDDQAPLFAGLGDLPEEQDEQDGEG